MQLRLVDNPLFFGRRLYLQWLVDMFAKLETANLDYIRNNQSTLRADLYNHLTDAVDFDDVVQRGGKKIILPSSFTGSPRQMRQRYQDAMAT